MKLLEILQKELKEFPEGMFYAVQDCDSEVKFGKYSQPTLYDSGIWNRHESENCPRIFGLELAEDWRSAIVTKEMWENDRVKSKMINSSQKGHVHADIMALYAEDAKTTDKPWELWQIKDSSGKWRDLTCNPSFATHLGYRRKPKTHTVNGVEIPDFGFTPYVGCYFHCVNIGAPEFYETRNMESVDCKFTKCMLERGLIYPYTDKGQQAAILHAKAMLGIA